MNIRDLSITEIKEKLHEMLNTLEKGGWNKESYLAGEIEDELDVINKMDDFLLSAMSILGDSFVDSTHYNFKTNFQCVFDQIVDEYNDLMKKN